MVNMSHVKSFVLTEQRETIEDVDEDVMLQFASDCFRLEFTCTFDQRMIYSIDYAMTVIPYVMQDIHKFTMRNSKTRKINDQFFRFDDYGYNYCIEYQKNGYPHIHGTIFLKKQLKLGSHHNFEAVMRRKYGRAQLWATGKEDRVHNNDHFNGTWQEYIKKESKVSNYIVKFNEALLL